MATCFYMGLVEFEREMRMVVARARLRLERFPLPLRTRPAPSACREHPPFDLAHWLPNMPRGHERIWRSRRPRYQFAGGVSG